MPLYRGDTGMTSTPALRVIAAALSCVALAAPSAPAQVVTPPFDSDYTVDLLGSVPGVPPNYGGLTFALDDPNTILIGGSANGPGGILYSIGVERDEENHVIGFVGTAEGFASAPYNDGGITYGPGDVLFLARWPVNELGQNLPDSFDTSKIIALGQFGVQSSLSAIQFVPAGFPGAGSFKMVTYSSGHWYDAAVVPDGNGTYDLTNVNLRVQIPGGPEGFVYVPAGSPQFDDFSSILVAEYAAGRIATYEIDGDGDPILTTRRDFLTGLTGAEGAVVDPLTGDFLFSTFGGSNQVVAVRGFGSPNACIVNADCAEFEDACHTSTCSAGSCATVTLPNGTSCWDGLACTTFGVCDDGDCVGQADCPSTPACSDTCDEETGECRTCGHPFSNDRCVVNAVFVLQGALELRSCDLCHCDVDLTGSVNATDALSILRTCAGIPVSLECPTPTTTTSTTSSTIGF
jgi:hypothetical protein